MKNNAYWPSVDHGRSYRAAMAPGINANGLRGQSSERAQSPLGHGQGRKPRNSKNNPAM